MNHIYRVIFARALGRCVVTSELAHSPRGGLSATAHGHPLEVATGPGVLKSLFAALLFTGSIGLAHATPIGGQVLAGTGRIGVTGNTTTITQTSPTLHLAWQSFNVGADQTVTFKQPTSQSLAVNNILSTAPSLIDGHIEANGQVWLINPEGLIFGKGASVNTAGFVASTLAPTTMANGTTVFAGQSTGSVMNDGSLTAAPGGYVALLGETVTNNGLITASLGTVALAGGSAVDLTFTGNHLVNVVVDQSTLNTLVANHTLIVSPGGDVLMTAGAANTLAASVVNNTGVIQAQTVADHNGTITLLGSGTNSTVTVGGTLNASAPQGGNGGFINTSAQTVNLRPGAVVTASAASGVAGTWLLDPIDLVINSTAATTIDNALNTGTSGTNITEQTTSTTASGTGTQVSGTGSIDVNAPLTWSTRATLTLDAYNNVNVTTPITATGGGGLAITTGDVSTTATTKNNGTGTLNLQGGDIQFTGVDSATGDPTGSLTINGSSYTLLNAANLSSAATATTDYALADNITLSTSTNFTPLFESTPYTGTFDGLGNTISNLTENTSDEYVGLFGQVGVGGVIENVGLVGGSVSAASSTSPPKTNYVGDLVGQSDGTLTNDYATGTVYGSASSVSVIGGLVGHNGGTLTNDYATGAVSGNPGTNQKSYKVGGLVGQNTSGTLTNDYATGTVQGGSGEQIYTGGLVGFNLYGNLTNDYATGDINPSIPTALQTDDTGGLVGYNNSGQLQYDYATGTVQAGQGGGPTVYAPYPMDSGNYTGGLVGSNNTGTLTDDYATGNVTGGAGNYHGGIGSIPDTGGLVGANDTGTLSYDYATGNVSGFPAGGFVGESLDTTSFQDDYWDTTSDRQTAGSYNGQVSTGVTGETTAQLSGQPSGALPTGFSSAVWGNLNNQTTPYLLSNNGPVLIGTSASTSPFTLIFTVAELQAINNNLSANYALAQNLNATGYAFTPIGETTAYTGTFDGLGNTISDLTESTSDHFAGLFGQVGSAGTVQNVGLVGGSITNTGGSPTYTGDLVGRNDGTLSYDYATGTVTDTMPVSVTGGLVGQNTSGTLTNDYATGAVQGGTGVNSATGGLVGWNVNGFLQYDYATGVVTGTVVGTGTGNNTGGLVGYSSGGSLSYDYAIGAVTAGGTGTSSGSSSTGGLVGYNSQTALTNDYATGAVKNTGTSHSSSNAGGLVGYNYEGTLQYDYATGAVTGGTGTKSTTGGLVGNNAAGSLTDDYATGNVTGGAGTSGTSSTGGLVGLNATGALSLDYATGAVTGGTGTKSATGGLVGGNGSTGTSFNDTYWDTGSNISSMVGVGSNAPTTGVTGLTNTQMLQSSSFTGFDFTSTTPPIWVIYNGHTMPLLASFLTPLTVTADSLSSPYTGSSSTASLAGATYSVTGAAASGNLFGLTAPYAADINAGTYSPMLWSDQQGYDITVSGGALTITPATLTYNATASSYQYGVTVPAQAGTVTGFVNGQTLSTATTGSATFTTTATSASNVGSYAIDGSGLTADNGNYTFTQAGGNTTALTITQAPLTAASTATKVYDGTTTASLSGGDTTFTGFVSGQGATVNSGVTGTFATSNAGNGITITGGALTSRDLTATGSTLLSNYSLPTSDSGTGSITQATLTYTATPVHLFTGESFPTRFTGTLSGLGAGQTSAMATTGSLHWTTSASADSPVGSYAIEGGGLTVTGSNYASTILEAPTNSTALTINAGTLGSIAGSNPAYAGLLGIDGTSDTTTPFTQSVKDYSLSPPVGSTHQTMTDRSVYGTYTVSHPEPLLKTPVKTPLFAGLDIQIKGGGMHLPAFLAKTPS